MPNRGAERFSQDRHAGVLVPLFSIPSRRSWGIGELPDLVPLARWLRSAGLDFVQLLPLNEMQEGQSSPYSALSAMAIDPIFIALDDVDEWVAAGAGVLDEDDRRTLAAVRSSERVNYARVRALKTRALGAAFAWFDRHVWGAGDRRDRALRAFQQREAAWLDDYALFRAVHDAHGGRHWREWDAGLRDRDPDALAEARARLDARVRYYSYLQWIADEQWHRARTEAAPVGVFGDFPFMVSGHSADVWARQQEFDLDASVGTPPDAFSATGQDWGLPAYRWDVLDAGGFEWLRQRARRSADLYDGFRIDHLIGFFRTYVRKPDVEPAFWPAEEHLQRAMGEHLLTLFADSGASLIGEDLGTVPDFLRVSLAERGIPGMKVMRWERDWHASGHPFIDPATYAPASVATSGTHDTESLAEWWDSADEAERRALLELPALAHSGIAVDAPYSDRVRDTLLETLFASGSRLLILPLQDIFGWRDRVNVPAVVDDKNWTWRLPAPVDAFAERPDAQERARYLSAVAHECGRKPF
ncbi:MAG TPA: 4-alpha-glucanotransferase [Vicinamibacterales bacterium]|nr:4-alpha-glucanotransferase [Vicinamibacterales bacterium]